MPASYTSLVLSDGTTSANLVDNANYLLQEDGWAPSVSYLRESTFGGTGPFEDVDETITVDVIGVDTATALNNISTITSLLMQARRWKRGESVNAVVLKCQPQGSTLAAPLQATVLGTIGAPGVIHPSAWNDLLMVQEIDSVQLAFTRRGAWLGVTDTVSGSSANNPNPTTLTLPAHPYESPLEVDIALTTTGGSITTDTCTQYVLYTTSPYFTILDVPNFVEVTSGSGTATTVADVANNAVGASNNIKRIATDSSILISWGVPAGSAAGSYELFAVTRNTSGTDFSARTRLYDGGYGRAFPYGPYRTIPSNSGNIQIVSLGVVTCAQANVFQFELSQTTGASKAIDFNYFVMMPVESVLSGCVAVQPGNSGYAMSGTGTANLVIDHQALTKPDPFVGIKTSLASPLDYTGNAYLTTQGTTIQVLRLAVDGLNWRHVSNTGVIIKDAVTVKRTRAYLTPQ